MRNCCIKIRSLYATHKTDNANDNPIQRMIHRSSVIYFNLLLQSTAAVYLMCNVTTETAGGGGGGGGSRKEMLAL